MTYQRIVVIYKKSTLQMYQKNITESRLEKKNPALYDILQAAHKEHYDSVDVLKSKLKAVDIPVIFYCRGEGRMPVLGEKDIVIALGGDGTFIYASHYVKTSLMVGVNSAPDYSIGHYCKYNLLQKKPEFTEVLRRIIEGKEKVTQLYRLKISINGETLKIPILNDILITDKNPATTTRYIIDINGKCYTQKSSGIWIATSMGSSAAYTSSGGLYFPQHNNKKQKQFGLMVREIYRPEKGTFTNGLIAETDHLEITISMMEGVIYLDGGQKKTRIRVGDKIKIDFQDMPLNSILD